MGQLMIMRKIINKFYISFRFMDMGAQMKGAALILFILNIKKEFDYLLFTSQWGNNSE
jgi:hypothetical protein